MRTKNQTLWDLAEAQAARYFGAERVRASGMGFHKSDIHQTQQSLKGSVSLELGYRGEVKSTISHRLCIQSSWFGKIAYESRNVNQLPAMYFMFGDLSAFACVPYTDDDYSSMAGVLALNSVSTSFTPDDLRHLESTDTGLSVPEYTFIKAKCGKAWIFPYWKINEDK